MPDLLERLKSALGDRYGIEKEIGRGGMAVVFLAEDLKHRRKVALKVLHPELTATLGAERFLQEIEIVAGLQHPHILPLYDSGEAEGLLYYVMPYARGESLRHRLDREKQLAVDESVRITVEVADGLDYAHRQGVVHRDIKPGNILLAEGHATIADFGIARAVEAARQERITRTGLGVGTPLYASPEQATAQETLDGRTDIYSLGCVLYEMLAGEPPLTGATPQMIQARRLSETPTALHTLRDTVPPALDHVIARALARVPADRYATASQFGQALQAVLFAATPAAMADLAATPGALSITPTTVSGPARRRVPVWLVIAVASVGVAAGTWFLSQPAGPSDSSSEPVAPTTNEFREVQLTSVGDVFRSAISPDGEWVAYCTRATGATPPKLVLSPIENPEAARELARFDFCSRVRWLSDGSTIVVDGIFRDRSGTYFVPRLGGAPKQIQGSCSQWDQSGVRRIVGGVGPVYSPDGIRCASHEVEAEAQQKVILVSPIDGSAPPDTIVVEGEYEYLDLLDWLPGDRLSFETGSMTDFGTIWTIRPDGSDLDSIVSIKNPFVPSWSKDGRALYYTPGAGQVADVMRLRIGEDGSPEGEPELLLSQFERSTGLSFSSDGRRAVHVRGTRQDRIVRLARDREGGSTMGIVTAITDWSDGPIKPAVSRSGDRIAYSSPEGTFWIPIDGGTPTLMAAQNERVEWSPDDRFQVYSAGWQDTMRLWIRPTDQFGVPGIIEGEANLHSAKWLGPHLFARSTPPGPASSNIRLLDSLQAWHYEQQDWVPLPEAVVLELDWRRGIRARGRWLLPASDSITLQITPAAVSPDGSQLLVVWFRTLDGSRATDSTRNLTHWLFSLNPPDGTSPTRIPLIAGQVMDWTEQGLYVWEHDPTAIYLQDLEGGDRKLLLEIPWQTENISGCDLRLVEPVELVCIQNETNSDAWLIENFDPHVN